MLDRTDTIKEAAHNSHKDKETFDFQLLLDQKLYTNLNSLHLCFPMKFKKATNEAQKLEGNVITVNNFFGHWIKEINITVYGTNKNLILTTTLS